MKYRKRDVPYAEYSEMRIVNMCVGLARPQCRRSPLWAPCPCRTPSTGPSTHCWTTLLPLPNSSYSENVAGHTLPYLESFLSPSCLQDSWESWNSGTSSLYPSSQRLLPCGHACWTHCSPCLLCLFSVWLTAHLSLRASELWTCGARSFSVMGCHVHCRIRPPPTGCHSHLFSRDNKYASRYCQMSLSEV